MEIQKDVRVGDTATTTPGPVPTLSSSQLVVAPHHGQICDVLILRLVPQVQSFV